MRPILDTDKCMGIALGLEVSTWGDALGIMGKHLPE
jgi:hypothetical protein